MGLIDIRLRIYCMSLDFLEIIYNFDEAER